MDEGLTLLAAAGAGILSFISPAVLPFVPGYLSFVSGAPEGAPRASRARVLLSSLAFAAGFTLVFVALGASAGAVGQLLAERLTWLGRAAGVVVVLFGLHAVGVFRARRPATPLGAGLVGMAFGFGWTPCIGPILAGVLALAGVLDSAGAGARLLGAYSTGLALPFLATSLVVAPYAAGWAVIRSHYRVIEIAAGALLVAIGALVITDRFALVSGWLTF